MPNIKCYNGELFVFKNAKKEKDPKLEVCRGVCVSSYYRTDVTFTGVDSETVLAGSWSKECVGRKGDLTKIFGEDMDMTMDQCVEEKKGKKDIKVCMYHKCLIFVLMCAI